MLVTGIVTTLREARIARQNEARAERRLQQTRELTSSLIGELPDALGEGPTQAKALMNAKALEYLKQLIEEESANPKLSFDLAVAHFQLADSLGNPGNSNTGDLAGAKENYRQAIDLLEHQLKIDPSNISVRYYLSVSYNGYSVAILWTDVSTALEMQKKTLALLPPDELAVDLSPSQRSHDLVAQQDLGHSHFIGATHLSLQGMREQAYELIAEDYGDPYFANLGDTSQGLENMQKAVKLVELLHKTYPYDYGVTRALYYSYIQTAAILWAHGKNKEALEFQKRGEEVLDSLSVKAIVGAQAPRHHILREERATAMTRSAGLLLDMDRLQEARAALRESREMLESLFWNDSMNAGLRRDLTRNYNMSADALGRSGEMMQSLDLYQKALALSEEVLTVQPDLPNVRQQYADSHEGLGNLLLQMGKNASALENCRKALGIRQSLAKLDVHDALYAFSLAKNYMSLAQILAKTRDRPGAISSLHSALEIQESLAAKDPANALVARDLASARRQLRDLHRK